MSHRLILLGAPAAVLSQGDVPGHTILRVPYVDGVTDVEAWIADVIAAWRALPDGPHELRAVVLRYQARPTAAALEVRDEMLRRSQAMGARLVLAVPASEVAWTEAAAAARPHPIRTYATTPAQLAAWVAAHPWPVPLDPDLGGTGVRVGGGRHAPWSLCVTDPVPGPAPDPGDWP